MKILNFNKTDSSKQVRDIEPGTCFEYNQELWIRTELITKDSKFYYAVSLKTGKVTTAPRSDTHVTVREDAAIVLDYPKLEKELNFSTQEDQDLNFVEET